MLTANLKSETGATPVLRGETPPGRRVQRHDSGSAPPPPDAASGRFQISRKIITAFFAAMQFDGYMKTSGQQMAYLPACIGGGFNGLIGKQNQHGAAL